LAAFERDPSALVVYGDADHIDGEDRLIGQYPTEEWSLERLKLVCFLCQPAVFFRRSVLEQFGLFDARLNHCMDYEYWLRLGMRGLRFLHIPFRLAASRLHATNKTLSRPREVHTEINDMLKERIGMIPDNWLSNYAHAVLDGRGVARTSSRDYRARVAMLTIGAAFRWNGFPSMSLLRTIASSLLQGSYVRQEIGRNA
jgi:GT2 family glycosyltransferase